MTLVERVEKELAALPGELGQGALAGLALVMASRIDEGKGSPSECAKAMSSALRDLRELAREEGGGEQSVVDRVRGEYDRR